MEPLTERDRYLSLTTSRRDGTPVATPVWFAMLHDGRIAVVTDADSGKRKRLEHTARCSIAACDVRGRVRGAPLPAHAEIVEGPDDMQEGLSALAARYGLQWRAFNIARRVRRIPDATGRVILLLTVEA